MTAALAEHLQAQVAPDLLARLSEEVRLVEEELVQQVDSPVRLVREAARHTLHAGGKRLRPALVTLAAEGTGVPFDPVRTRRLGACMEMIHMATLMHDDVIDHAATRRGVETASSRFGNTAGILTGDVLLSRAMAILADDGDLEIIRSVSRAVVDLAEGEVQELEARGRIDLSEEEHFEILHRKTATFIASCCQVGALAASAPAAAVEALAKYGAAMGMAFQIADDCLDFGDPAATGKPSGTDFGEGCATLPVILLHRRMEEADRSRLASLFGKGATNGEWDWVRAQIDQRGTREEAEGVARRYVEAAQSALQALPESSARELLATVAEFVVWRKA